MTDIAIRPATPDDAGDATALIARAYAPWTARLPDLPDVTGGVAEDIRSGGVFVAVAGKTLAGVLFTGRNGDTLHLRNVAVDPAFGGQGIGSALVRHAESIARDRGLARLALATHSAMTGNLRLYARLGWRQTGRDGNKVFMEREIADP